MASTRQLTLNADMSTASFPSMSSEADDDLPPSPKAKSEDGSSKHLASKTSTINGYDAFVDVDLTKAKFGDRGGVEDKKNERPTDKASLYYSTPEHFIFWKLEVNRALLPLKLIMFCFYGGT